MAKQLAFLTPPVRRVRLTTWDLLQNRLSLDDILRQHGIDPDQPYHRDKDPDADALIFTQEMRGAAT